MISKVAGKAVAGIASVMLLGSVASASDPTPAPVTSWTGAYAGIQVGGSWTGSVFSSDINGYNDSGFALGGDEGLIGGVQLGYNYQVGRWVFGIEGEVGSLGLQQSAQFPDYVGVRLPTDSLASVDHGLFATVAGRVGVTFDRTLIYAKAGWGWVDTDVSFIDKDPTGLLLVSGTHTSKTLDGAVFGGGIEFLLTGNLSIKLEYERFDIDDVVRVTAKDNVGITRRFDHSIDAIDTVKLGLNLKLQ
jgi:outer membrane immunogenic protein